MHYRNDNQNINKDDIEPSNEKLIKTFIVNHLTINT